MGRRARREVREEGVEAVGATLDASMESRHHLPVSPGNRRGRQGPSTSRGEPMSDTPIYDQLISETQFDPELLDPAWNYDFKALELRATAKEWAPSTPTPKKTNNTERKARPKKGT